jgi:hypothetical protein
MISDELGVGERLPSDGTGATTTDTAIAAASDASEVFTNQIDWFGDPTVRTFFLVFGGVVVVLAGLSVLSKKVDDAIENVVGEFEGVLLLVVASIGLYGIASRSPRAFLLLLLPAVVVH